MNNEKEILKPIEQRVINGKKFNVFRSLNNKYILQVETGVPYSEAVDLETVNYTYVETDEPIEVEYGNQDYNE